MQEEIARKNYLFICTGTRCHELSKVDSEGTSILQKEIKALVKEKGWKDTVRVSKSGCLGSCETAPNILFQPQNRLCSGVTLEDKSKIIDILSDIK